MTALLGLFTPLPRPPPQVAPLRIDAFKPSLNLFIETTAPTASKAWDASPGSLTGFSLTGEVLGVSMVTVAVQPDDDTPPWVLDMRGWPREQRARVVFLTVAALVDDTYAEDRSQGLTAISSQLVDGLHAMMAGGDNQGLQVGGLLCAAASVRALLSVLVPCCCRLLLPCCLSALVPCCLGALPCCLGALLLSCCLSALLPCCLTWGPRLHPVAGGRRRLHAVQLDAFHRGGGLVPGFWHQGVYGCHARRGVRRAPAADGFHPRPSRHGPESAEHVTL